MFVIIEISKLKPPIDTIQELLSVDDRNGCSVSEIFKFFSIQYTMQFSLHSHYLRNTPAKHYDGTERK